MALCEILDNLCVSTCEHCAERDCAEVGVESPFFVRV